MGNSTDTIPIQEKLTGKWLKQYITLQAECLRWKSGIAELSFHDVIVLGLSPDVMSDLVKGGWIRWTMRGNGHTVEIVEREA